jgi:hypothetical protein
MGVAAEVAGKDNEARARDIASKSHSTERAESEQAGGAEHWRSSAGALLAGADSDGFLGHPAIGDFANTGPRAMAFHSAQQSFGNRLVQRSLARGNPHLNSGPMIQRKCACGGSCAKCSEAEPQLPIVPVQPASEEPRKVQAQPDSNFSGGTASLDGIIPSNSRGDSLDPGTRSLLESRFGQDFSGVRVHSDSAASESSRAIGARAYTSGQDIYFAPGQYSSGSSEGRHLLAHELAHVVQQRTRAAGPVSASPVIGELGDIYEQEAERAADAVTQDEAPRIVGAPPAGMLQKTNGDSSAPPPPTSAASSGAPPPASGSSQLPAGVRRVVLPKEQPFKIPGEKLAASDGDANSVLAIYKSLANNHQLVDLHTGRVESSAWPQWTRGRSKAAVDDLGNLRQTCSPDHVVELQVGGPDDARNLRLLDRERNRVAGTKIWNDQISPLKKANRTGDQDAILEFTEVVAEPAMGDEPCLTYDIPYWKGEQAGKSQRTREEDNVELSVGAAKAFVAFQSDGTVVRGSRFAISGFALKRITLDSRKPDSGRIEADLSSGVKKFLKDPKQQNIVLLIKENKVELSPESSKYRLLFAALSEADFTARLGDDGFSGEGKFNPTLPLLRKSVVQLKVEKQKFSGSLRVAPADLTLPIPGVRITESSLEVRIEEDGFSAGGILAFDVSTFVKAKLEAKADASGFAASGRVDFLIPGLDTAQGEIKYSDKKLSGRIEIGKDKFKLPGVKSAKLVVFVTEDAITGVGEIALGIPGIKMGTLGFAIDKKGNYGITGVLTLDIPGLKEAEVGISYHDGDIEGTAKVGLDIPGLKDAGAQFDLKYAKGAITGAGEITYKKGKLSGKVHAALSEKHKISGGGELAYEIIPGLVAGVGIEIREDGTTKISGELKIPAQINLFPEKKIEKTIFSVSIQIPIFAIPLGTRSVGLVAEIGADLKARAGVGPGQIRQLKVKAAFDPAKEESKFEFSGGGELYVPAYAEIALGVHGGIGLSLAIASATGGIELVGALGLQGALSAMVQIAYQDSKFMVDAVAELSAQPVLKFSINAYVKVDVILIGEVYRKDWNLASKEWGSGLKIGMRFPVHYEFGKPFEISLSQVEFIVPDIDYKKAVKDLLPI